MAKKEFQAESKKLMDMMINSIYTNKEIFLRELISNASDAIDKLYYKSLTDTSVGMNKGDFRILITRDKENRILTVEDNGIGMTKEELENKIATFTGGRAAEELIFGEMTTGAANDIEQATKLARNMVTRFGMSDEFGMMALGTVQNAYLNQDTSLTCAPGTAERVDAIVAKLIEDAHDRALQILKENKFKLHELARYLYKKETITGEEFMNLLTRENPLMPKQQ